MYVSFLYNSLFYAVENTAGDVDTAGTCLREAAGNAGTIADGKDVLERGFEFFGENNAGTVEFDFNTVEQGVIIGHTRGDVVECLDHFDDVVEMPFGQYERQITRRSLQRRFREALRHAVGIGAASFHEVAKALDDDAAAEHV